MNDIVYTGFNELELTGEYKGFDWSIENFGTSYEVKYLLVRLYLTDEWKVSKKVSEDTVLYQIKQGTFNQYLKEILDEIIKELKKATEKFKD